MFICHLSYFRIERGCPIILRQGQLYNLAVLQSILTGDTTVPADPDDFKPKYCSDSFLQYVSLETISKSFQDALRPCKGSCIMFSVQLVPLTVWNRIVSTVHDPLVQENNNKFRAVKNYLNIYKNHLIFITTSIIL